MQVAPNVPKALADAVMVGLAKEKEQRWSSAKEFNHALRAAMGLPLPGSTPIPPRATLGGQRLPPAVSNVDSESMMLGSTAQPQRATPMPAPSGPSAQPVRPVAAPAPRQPTPAPAQGWVVPTGPGGQNQPLPVSTPAVSQPMAPMMPVARAPYTQPPPSGTSSPLKWVAIIGGGLIGLCCMCLGVGSMSDSLQTAKEEVVPPSDESIFADEVAPASDPVPLDETVADTLDQLEKFKVKKTPKTPEDAVDEPALDPNGRELYDSLTFKKGAPTAEELRQLFDAANELSDEASAPDKRDRRRAAEKLQKLRQVLKSRGKLNERQLEEFDRLRNQIAPDQP
jgi:hypothetical protein